MDWNNTVAKRQRKRRYMIKHMLKTLSKFVYVDIKYLSTNGLLTRMAIMTVGQLYMRLKLTPGEDRTLNPDRDYFLTDLNNPFQRVPICFTSHVSRSKYKKSYYVAIVGIARFKAEHRFVVPKDQRITEIMVCKIWSLKDYNTARILKAYFDN